MEAEMQNACGLALALPSSPSAISKYLEPIYAKRLLKLRAIVVLIQHFCLKKAILFL